jgi:transcriptional/translational regulatory protein YebC/TACO1
MNPALAAAIAAAKKASVPKDKIEAAIARGQGKSEDGVALEQMTIEAVIPPSIALILDVETDSKGRVLQAVNQLIKKAKGSTGSSKFFFTRRGQVVLDPGDSKLGVDDIMDEAIEAGAEDLENDEDGNIVVWTQPTDTMGAAKTLSSKFGFRILSSEIVWTPNEETKVTLDAGEDLENFVDLLEKLQSECPDIQAMYANVARGSMTDEQWARIQSNLDS